MLEQAEEMRGDSNTGVSPRLVAEAEDQFLNTLLSWGTTNVLNDFVDLFQYQCDSDGSYGSSLETATASLERRRDQTAAVYLSFQTAAAISELEATPRRAAYPNNTQDSLFEVGDAFEMFKSRVSLDEPNEAQNSVAKSESVNEKVALDAMAKLSMMKGRFDEALRFFLVIGALHSSRTMEEIEENALLSVSRAEIAADAARKHQSPYAYVIRFIEKHHLHQYVLDKQFLPRDLNAPPLFALAKLVGLELLARFLLEHCVAQQRKPSPPRHVSSSSEDQRRGTLPLNAVAGQLEASPELLHWYLHLLFVNKPGLYVNFPKTASPPTYITELHRRHLDLHIRYAGVNRDSTKVLEGLETYRVAGHSTPLLSFLKVRRTTVGFTDSECIYSSFSYSLQILDTGSAPSWRNKPHRGGEIARS